MQVPVVVVAGVRRQLNLLLVILFVHLIKMLHHLVGVLGRESVLQAAGARVSSIFTSGARKVAFYVAGVKMLPERFVVIKLGRTLWSALVAFKVVKAISVKVLLFDVPLQKVAGGRVDVKKKKEKEKLY